MDLKNIPTTELIKELESRQNVQKFDVVPYGGYNISIVEKFSENRTPIQLPATAKVLVIED